MLIARKPHTDTIAGRGTTSSTTKLSRSSPHLTTDAYEGSSSILDQRISVFRRATVVFASISVEMAAYLYSLRTCGIISKTQ